MPNYYFEPNDYYRLIRGSGHVFDAGRNWECRICKRQFAETDRGGRVNVFGLVSHTQMHVRQVARKREAEDASDRLESKKSLGVEMLRYRPEER